MYYYNDSLVISVFAAVSGYANEFCGRLINSGYSVKGGFKGGLTTFSHSNFLGEIISVVITKFKIDDEKPFNQLDVSNLVGKILNEMGAKYFGIVTGETGNAMYALSNIPIPQEPKPEEPKAEDEKSEAPVQSDCAESTGTV